MKFLFLLICIAPLSLQAQMWGAYTLYATKNGTKAYLIDTSGTTYKTWTFPSDKKSSYSAYLIPGDTLVRTYKPSINTSWNGGGISGGVQKIAWDGSVAWDYHYFSANAYCTHHDIHPMPNGNVLLIAYEIKQAAEAVQAGCSSSMTLWSEKIIEVKPTGPASGTIVWEWKLWDHLCQNFDPSKDNYVTSVLNNPQRLNINFAPKPGQDRWHMNGLDYNEELDQIAFSMHYTNEIYIIDHSTTTAEAAGSTGGNSGKGGDFLYRWGNPAAYNAPGQKIFSTVHDVHWVAADNPDYPGYLCAFNNQGGTGGNSAVDIWNPPYDGYNYTHTAGTAYTPSTYAHRYTAPFSSTNEGNSQQLPNGNMLVNNSFGAVYEINSAGSVIWTKPATNSTHCYRYSLCYVRGPVASASASATNITAGTPVTLFASGLSVTESNPVHTYEWSSVPAGLSSPDQNPVVTPAITTTYIVTVTNAALGCSDTASVTIQVGASALEQSENNGFRIFPNPTAGLIYIEKFHCPNYEILVQNTYGARMLHTHNGQVLDVSDFENGLYFIQIRCGTEIWNQKIILIK